MWIADCTTSLQVSLELSPVDVCARMFISFVLSGSEVCREISDKKTNHLRLFFPGGT